MIDDAARVSSAVKAELPGKQKELKTEGKALGAEAGAKVDQTVRKTRARPPNQKKRRKQTDRLFSQRPFTECFFIARFRKIRNEQSRLQTPELPPRCREEDRPVQQRCKRISKLGRQFF